METFITIGSPEGSTDSDEPKAVPRSVHRTFSLLEIVTAEGSINLSGAAARASLSAATALRYLRALEELGYLERHGSMYSAGPGLARVNAATRNVGPLADFVTACHPYLRQLSDITGESAYLAIPGREEAIYVSSSESRRPSRHGGWVGRSVPLDNSAVGAALRGAAAPQYRHGLVEPEVSAVAIAIFDGQAPKAAVSVVGPAERLDQPSIDRAGHALQGVRVLLSKSLGLRQKPTGTTR